MSEGASEITSYWGGCGRFEPMPLVPAATAGPEWTSCLGHGLLTSQPKAHPFWYQYVLAMVHLRDVPGQLREPVLPSPDATHNLMLMAVNPEVGHVKASDWPAWGEDPHWFLLPLNYSLFLGGCTDAQAVAAYKAFAQGLVRGQFPIEPEGIMGVFELVSAALGQIAGRNR